MASAQPLGGGPGDRVVLGGVFRRVSGSGVPGAGPKSTARETVEALVPQVTCMVPTVSQVMTLLSKHYLDALNTLRKHHGAQRNGL